MFNRSTVAPIAGCGLAATMVLAATIGLAGEPTVIRVHDVCSPSGGGDRVIVRSPARTFPDGPPGIWSPGITLVPHEAGITVLVESVAVTGDAPTPDDNDFTRIDLGVQSVAVLGDGTEVRLVGVFDWTEPAAASSWAAADYAVIAPPGVADVRILAAQLGDAIIEGPWELPDPTIDYEGFLHLFGGTFRGWSIENLVIRGFDWAIGMYYDSLGDFDGVTVRNNLIELPEDLPGSFSTPSGEPFQNIGVHLAFGIGQTIEGNEIVIPGSAEGNAIEFTSSVALQSNTSGGAGYDDLLISDNLIRITGSQAAEPERIFGIWENGAAHASDIAIRDNIFVNEDPGNDPTLNFQRAFRVTSQSSSTTTVSYTGNLAAGATIGIHWLGDGYTSSPPATTLPVVVETNTLLDNATAVWVHTDDLVPGPGGEPTRMSQANLRFNRIAGNLVGVRSDDAEVAAEDNWWGCSDGPGAGGCDPAVYSGSEGFLDPDPWLVLGTTAAPAVIPVAGQSVVTASLRFNSDGIDTSGSGFPPDGTPVFFGATGGVMDPAQGATVLGESSSVYTAGPVPGDFEVNATVDLATTATPVRVTGDASLAITMAPGLQVRDDGETAELSITVSNAGPDPATAVGVTVDFPVELGGIGWICVGSAGGVCTNQGSGDIADLAGLPVAATVTYTAIGALPDPFVGVLTVNGSAIPPGFVTDPDPGDNDASAEIRSVRIFDDGFESGDTSLWSATVP
jgi:hypothetical protein